MMKCKIDGCNDNNFAKGYCQKHYSKKWRDGDEMIHNVRQYEKQSGKCKVDGCNIKPKTCGYCTRHYNENLLYVGKICKIDGCNNQLFAKGMCEKHYRQELRRNKKG